MKYVFLFCGSEHDQAEYDSLGPDELRERYAQVGRWFAENHARLGHGNQLQGPETATTVRFQPNSKPVVMDGLFLEGKEIVGGYSEVEVADGYHIFHAARGELLSELGRRENARAARLRALELTNNQAERSLLERRLFHQE